ncbi:hypothetical protein [Ovoidimarina sediminis]|uniref:hypothetical protein n=1 Tax=Ovoidimarina sediminis TaxID=3079856 RepID=UPI00290846C4|nr:hypothetical protein [Rhodophyticola sp. MJ-SS7]MDU8943352.1 hypothetical protein [Rhodophyticola sp. MJ-SS7]
MAVLKDLKRIREAGPGIEAVAYVDMATSTVLATSSAIDEPQERFDGLCDAAIALLDGADGEPDEAVRMASTEALVVCRSAADQEEALCLVCAPDADVSAVMHHARAAFDAEGSK